MQFNFLLNFPQGEVQCEFSSKFTLDPIYDDVTFRLGQALRETRNWAQNSKPTENSHLRYSRLALIAGASKTENINWSMAGTKNYSAIAFTFNDHVGVDIEMREREILDFHFGLSKSEQKYIENLENHQLRRFAYLLLWVQKEAVFKSRNSTEVFNAESIEAPARPLRGQLQDWYGIDFLFVEDDIALIGQGPLVGSIKFASKT